MVMKMVKKKGRKETLKSCHPWNVKWRNTKMIITSDSSSIIVGCQPFIVNNDHCRNAIFPFFNNFFIYKNLIQFNIFPRKKKCIHSLQPKVYTMLE